MAAFGTVRGKTYFPDEFGEGKIRDNAVKGDAVLKYRVYMEK
jgi:hypothetical protein